jgi:peptide/nickel transport system permease protein
MRSYVARRLAVMPLLLLGVVTAAFLISRTIPANPLATLVGERGLGNPEVVKAAKARWGLDKPVPEQYLLYVRNVVRGDMGVSFHTRNPVRKDLSDRFPATIELTMAAMIIGVAGGLGLGVVAARRQNKAADHGARFFALVGSSLPVFWAGLILLFILYARLSWLPGPGRLDSRTIPPTHYTGLYTVDALLSGRWSLFVEAVRHLILPAFTLGWGVMGIISRLVRASMLDELGADYVRTARAKGLSERQVLRRHALRNALLPTLTIVGFTFAFLITGAVLTETVFSWPGIGSYAVDASRSLDFPAIMGVSVVGGVVFLLANLVTDLTYVVADPRIRLS